jgi:hypothetical protein
MYIIMASNAVWFSFFENQTFMTLSAIYLLVRADQGQLSSIVVKRVNWFIKLPALWTVTGFAAYLKIRAMRGFGPLIY